MIQALKDNGVPQKEMFLLFYPEFSLWSPIRLDDGTWCNFMQPKWQAELAKRLRLLRDWLKEKGFGYEQYAFYPTDEPHGDPETPGTRLTTPSPGESSSRALIRSSACSQIPTNWMTDASSATLNSSTFWNRSIRR